MARIAARSLPPVGGESFSSYLSKNLAKVGRLSEGQVWRLPFPELFGNSLQHVLDVAAADLTAALTTLGRGGRLSELVVFATASQEVSAEYAPKEDGSGLVQVSDSLAALCTSYCQSVGHALSSAVDTSSVWRFFLRLAAAHFKGTLGGDPARLASVLRYHHVNRRAHGVATTLLTRQDLRDQDGFSHHDMTDLFLLLAIRFLLGHEMAHHVLAHRTNCSPSPEQESQADLLALRAGSLAQARDLKKHAADVRFVREQWLEDAGEFYGLIAAVIGMLAVQSLEEALMVRRGRTHLSARDRAAHLIELSLGDARIREHERTLGHRDTRFRKRIESERHGLESFTRSLVEATEKAADFGERLPGFDWTGLPPSQLLPPDAAHLQEVIRLDRLLGRPARLLAAALVHSPLRDGALHVLAGDTRRAMRVWGVPDATIRGAHDETTALAFYTLVHFIRSAGEAQGLTGTGLHELPVVAATSVARSLSCAADRRFH
ncbi:hypothetical protein SUDANB126_06289 [Streptomyces sp. enrichment culture]